MPTEAQIEAALVRVHARRNDWRRDVDQLEQDAQALSARIRGRALPPVRNVGQIPAEGVIIHEQVGTRQDPEIHDVVIQGPEIAWQNLANKISDTRATGLRRLDTLEEDLNTKLRELRQPVAAGGPVQPRDQPGKDPKKIYPWIDFLTDIIAYVLVFWGLVVAAQSFGLFTIFVGIGLLALTGVLQGVIINPIRAAIKIVFNALLQILIDLVEFFITWIRGVIEYFQGDLIRAVLQILIVAAFMWIWNLAQNIPVIRDIINFILDAVKTAVKFINDVFDTVTGWVEQLRRSVRQSLELTFSGMGELAKQLTGSIMGVVDRLFSGLESKLNQARFQLIGQIDVVGQFSRSTITLFGFRLQLVPEEVRKYLLGREVANPLREQGDRLALIGVANPDRGGLDANRGCPWAVIPELDAEIQLAATLPDHPAVQAVTEILADWAAMVSNAPPVCDDWDPALFIMQVLGITVPEVTLPTFERPVFVDQGEWLLVLEKCKPEHVAALAIAIGWHETNWGRLGHGLDGYTLGVGCPNGDCDPALQGLGRQLDWACPRLAQAFRTADEVTLAGLEAFAQGIFRVPAWRAWAADVLAQYRFIYRLPVGTR